MTTAVWLRLYRLISFPFLFHPNRKNTWTLQGLGLLKVSSRSGLFFFFSGPPSVHWLITYCQSHWRHSRVSSLVLFCPTEAAKGCGEGPQLWQPSVCLLPHRGWRWAFLCQPADALAAEGRRGRDGTRVGGEADWSGCGSAEPLQRPTVTGETRRQAYFWLIDTSVDLIITGLSVSTGGQCPWVKVQKPHRDCGRLWQARRGCRRALQGGIWLCWSWHDHTQTSGGEPQTTSV